MKFKTALLSVLAALALSTGLSYASFAQSSRKPTTAQESTKAAKKSSTEPTAAADRAMNGSVVALTAKSIVIRSNGKNSTFLINPETKETGNVAVKKDVTVHYHDQNKKHIATSIEESTGATKD